ncbi:hypothetical protein QTP88_005100 [Uroleucon formosanum]
MASHRCGTSKSGFSVYLIRHLWSYMGGRTLFVDDGDGDLTRMEVSCGVPQGSVIGPCLWNIFYDDLLRLEIHEAAKLAGFADDIALVITVPNADLLKNNGNASLWSIDRWMQENGLQVAPKKSEAVVLTNKWAYLDPTFILGVQQIPVRSSMRYLGVQLDTRLNFGAHIRLATAAARRTVSALGRLMPNVQGPSASMRRLFMSVAHSKLLYASPVSALMAAKTTRNRKALNQAQRGAAIRVARHCRVTDSTSTTCGRGGPNPYCMHCEEPEDTVEYTLFNCPFWAEDRREMEQCVGRPL